MPFITHRLLAFAAAMLFILTAPAVSAHASAGPADGSGRASGPAPPANDDGQSETTSPDDDGVLVLAEPDYSVLNLPSTLRLPVRGSAFRLTHRFNGNLRQGSFGANAGNLFGLDQGAAVGFEYRFGVLRHLQAVLYRTAIDKTLQLSGKYDAFRQSGVLPVSVSAVVAVEGADNFRSRYSPSLGVTISRTAVDRLALYATPVWVHNTAPAGDTVRDTVIVGVGARLRLGSAVYVVGEVAPRVHGYSPDAAAFGFAVEKRIGGHVFQLNLGNGQGTTFGQIARGGFPGSLYAGFNLARKFF